MNSAKNSRALSALLVILICMIVAASIAFAKRGRDREVVYYDTAPKYDPEIVQLGLKASKFGGMAIHMDSPSVLLNRAERLNLSETQTQGLQAIIAAARRDALTILTPAQLELVSPLATEPVILGKLSRDYASCGDVCALPPQCPAGCELDHAHEVSAGIEQVPGDDHDHDHGHGHGHQH
jgi:hypothetical protein